MSKKKGPQSVDGVLVVASNKTAHRDFEILEKFEAGLVLSGSEVKSIRAGEVNLKEAYVREKNGELFLVGCHITPYAFSRQDEIDPVRQRKLLMHKDEIELLSTKSQHKGLTMVPIKLYFKGGRCKLELGLGRGKKLHDKRQDIKAKEANRDMERALRRANS